MTQVLKALADLIIRNPLWHYKITVSVGIIAVEECMDLIAIEETAVILEHIGEAYNRELAGLLNVVVLEGAEDGFALA